MTTDTIIAPASALGGGVAVIRLSGAAAFTVAKKLCRAELPAPRMAQLVSLYHPTSDKLLDKALLLCFQNPHSFTGEDVVELHVHGGPAVVHSVIQAAILCDPTLRMAEGGEFSKRAYMNGKIDLTEAEAIADLVAAETDAQADLARAQMGGSLRNLYESWRGDVIKILAYLEATIDFVDEEDVPHDLFTQTTTQIAPLLQQMQNHLDDRNLGERLRQGFVVTIIGAPNAGKSSLVNLLARREVAIVSPTAGTTRDTLEVHLNIGGFPVVMIDTAGLRETQDAIESEGIARAKKRAQDADIVLALFDATQSPDAETLAQIDDRAILLLTKADLSVDIAPNAPMAISTHTGQNIDTLLQILAARLTHMTARPQDAPPLLTRARHRIDVKAAIGHLTDATHNQDVTLLAEDVRLATRALGRLTGRVDVEDLLDVIFKDFCIGK